MKELVKFTPGVKYLFLISIILLVFSIIVRNKKPNYHYFGVRVGPRNHSVPMGRIDNGIMTH